MAEDIRFLLNFDDNNSLDKLIRDLEQSDDLVKQLTKSYAEFGRRAAETQKAIQVTNDANQLAKYATEVGNLKSQYRSLTDEVDKASKAQKANKDVTDSELKAQIEMSEALNRRKKAIRESIKDQQAMKYTVDQEAKSIRELKDQTNALVRQRDKLDISNKGQRKEFDALTKKINSNTDQLKKYDELIGRHQRNVGNYKSALSGLGKQLLAVSGIGLGVSAVTSFFRDSTQAFQEFDASLKEVSAITGLTGEELDFFKEKALKAGSSTKTSAKDYLEAVKLIGSATPSLLKDKEALAQVTDQARILAEASGLDLPTAASALTSSLNQFQIPAKDAARVINALAAGSKEGAAEVPELSEAFKNVGTVANGANVSFEQTVALLETLAERQLKGAEAGTKLRGSILQLQKSGKGFKSGKFNIVDALKETNDELNKIKDPAARAQRAIKIFGAENITAGKILLENQNRFKELTTAVTGTNTALEQAAINNESAQAKSERLTNQLNVLYIQLGEKLLPVWNLFKEALVGIIQVIAWVVEAIGQIISSVEILGNSITDLKNVTDEYTQTSARLTELHDEGIISTEELQKSVTTLAKAYNKLDGASESTLAGEKLLRKELEKGKITVDEYAKGVDDLIKASQALQRGGVLGKSIQKQAEEVQQATEKASKEAEAARKKAFQNALQDLERRKTEEEIAIKKKYDDEEVVVNKLDDLNKSYLLEKALLEKRFGEEYKKTLLQKVDAEIATNKRIKTEQEKLQDQLAELNIQNLLDEEQKEIESAMRKTEKKLEQIKGDSEIEKAIRLALQEELNQELLAIDKKYRDKELEEKIKLLDKEQKENLLYALRTNKSEEEIKEQQLVNDINRLEQEIQLRKKAGKETLDQEIELENKRRELKDNEAEKDKERAEKTAEFVKDTLQGVQDKYVELLEQRQDKLEKEVDLARSSVERQEELAAQGLENTLAFEKKEAAEKEKLALENQRRIERAKEREAYLKLLSAYAEKDPDQAAAKALIQLAIAKAIVARFEDGGIVADEVAKQNGGILKGASHRNGGILIEAEGEEGIFSKKEMRNLGKDNFYAIKNMLKNPATGDVFAKDNAAMTKIIMRKESTAVNIEPLVKATQEVKRAVEEKPTPTFIIDRFGNGITKESAKSLTRYKIQPKRNFNR